MLSNKGTSIFSEINSFFPENDNRNAINSIMDIARHLKINGKSLSIESNDNCKFTRLQVLELLLLFPLFMVKNAFHYSESVLFKVLSCKKDVFYRFMANGSLDWRKILYRINLQLIGKIAVRADSCSGKDPVCLIVDDSDLPKTGKKIERIGRIFSHVTHSSIIGFKALFLCRTDGKTQTVPDFSLHGEEGSRPEKPFGMTREQRQKQYRRERKETEAVQERNGDWTGLLTTNTKLDFFEAYHIYSMRWSVEVFFKEAKSLLGLGKSQSRDFASQIASISIAVLQYNILGTVKRFRSYETIGGLFHQATDGVVQLSVTERIWGILQELVRIIAEAFLIDDERVMDTLINRSETFKHFINIDNLELKQAA